MAYEMTTLGEAETPSHQYEMVGKAPESAPVINDEDQYEVPSLPVTSGGEVGVVSDKGKEE